MTVKELKEMLDEISKDNDIDEMYVLYENVFVSSVTLKEKVNGDMFIVIE